jgi:cobalt-zinc-cadmium efflux system membrane fusion protein
MSIHRKRILFGGIVVLGGLLTLAVLSHHLWLPWFGCATDPARQSTVARVQAQGESQQVKLTPQAQRNLRLVSKPLRVENYWRTLQLPGAIIDRPAQSDRHMVAPVTGVVAKVYAFPGNSVRPGDTLFVLRLVSESMRLSQSELFKNTQEIKITHERRKRLADPALEGAISQERIIELDNQLSRLEVAAKAYRQDLVARGLTPPQIDRVSEGEFVSQIEIRAPQRHTQDSFWQVLFTHAAWDGLKDESPAPFEVQELKVELGQQVQTGQTLCLLSDHRALYIEGRGFRHETPHLERAAKEGSPVDVEFMEDKADDQEFVFLGASSVGLTALPFGHGPFVAASALNPSRVSGWPPLLQTFRIRHLANTIDPASRTFAFYIPLINQSRSFEKDGRNLLLWRFRPGQKVRLHIKVEKFENVLPLPADAVVREWPEAYVFRQNGDLFERRPVHVVFEDRRNVVLANDGAVRPRIDYVAQGAAASLNRILKAQNASGGLPPGAHFHADGTLHIPGQ